MSINCKAITQAGHPCKNRALSNGYCHIHDPDKVNQVQKNSISEKPKYSFSQRKGITPISQVVQIESMNQNLRNSLWNVLYERFCFQYFQNYFLTILNDIGEGITGRFAMSIWTGFFKHTLDSLPDNNHQAIKNISDYFKKANWYEIYDLIEYVIGEFDYPYIVDEINEVLAREMSGYRIVDGIVTDIVNPQELDSLKDVLESDEFPGVINHLKRALELMSDRENPDYRNSIKESISAVESIAKAITRDSKATLGSAIKSTSLSDKMHPAMNKSLLSLYGYTSDENGIRHAMLEEEPDLDVHDARFFLLSCTSFINYLKSKIN